MKISKALIGAAVLALAATIPAQAGFVLDWDPAYMWQAGATPTNSPNGGEFKAVGIVSAFDAPLGHLDASDPTKEYTFYLEGLISQGTVTIGPPATEFYTTNYTGGTIVIYCDDSPESVFDPNPPNTNVPSTFIDGTLILSGNFTSFITQTNNFTAFQTGNAEGEISWTGGSELGKLNDENGQPCPGLFTGGMTWRTDVGIPGYLFRHDGKIDLNCPVPVETSTWSRIKAQY